MRQFRQPCADGTRGFIVETPRNVETPHPVETFPPHSVFYFRATKSFHVNRRQGPRCRRPGSVVTAARAGTAAIRTYRGPQVTQHRRHCRVEHRALLVAQRPRMTHHFPRAQHSVDGLVTEALAQRREVRRLFGAALDEERAVKSPGVVAGPVTGSHDAELAAPPRQVTR
jgi:hypothetical protein